MTNAIAERPTMDAGIVERVLLHGDLKQLSPAQKISYYKAVCESVGLNPLTQPFAYIVLNGKEVLYAKREATEQLRQIHHVSIDPRGFVREVIEGVYVVTAPASLPDGRTDVSTGAVWIEGLKGEARANAMLKAETKAKRRVTLSICGLGMLDETEVETIPNAGYVVEAPSVEPVRAAANDRKGPVAGDGGGSPAPSDLPPGAVLIRKTEKAGPRDKAKGFLFTSAMPAFGEGLPVYREDLLAIAEQRTQDQRPVYLELKESARGNRYVVGITDAQTGDMDPQDDHGPVDLDQMPF